MSLYDKIAGDSIRPDLGTVVDLFELHLTALGGPIYRFTPNTVAAGANFTSVAFGGQTYYPREVRFDGLAVGGGGPPARPTLACGDLDGEISGLCRDYGNLLGAVCKRRRTLAKYLDGRPAADSAAEWPAEVYIVNRRLRAARGVIEFELTPYLDREGVQIPGEVVLRDICLNIYRKYTGSGFDAASVRPCPYDGATYYGYDDAVTADPAADKCSKTLAGCRARYGQYAELPFRACPGVARVRR